jgi:hypothetical protein
VQSAPGRIFVGGLLIFPKNASLRHFKVNWLDLEAFLELLAYASGELFPLCPLFHHTQRVVRIVEICCIKQNLKILRIVTKTL